MADDTRDDDDDGVYPDIRASLSVTSHTASWMQTDPDGQAYYSDVVTKARAEGRLCCLQKHLSTKQSGYLRTLGIDPASPGLYLTGNTVFCFAVPTSVTFCGNRLATQAWSYVDASDPLKLPKVKMDVYAITLDLQDGLELAGALSKPPDKSVKKGLRPAWSFFKSDCESMLIGPITEMSVAERGQEPGQPVLEAHLLFTSCAYLHFKAQPGALRPPPSETLADVLARQARTSMSDVRATHSEALRSSLLANQYQSEWDG